MTSRLAAATAAAALAGASLLGLSAPAFAQTPADYPRNTAAGVSDNTVTPGQTITATSGSGVFAAGAQVTVTLDCPGAPRNPQTVTANADGEARADVTVPTSAKPGRCAVVFSSGTDTVRVPFTVVSAAAASTGRGQLPRTGSDDLVGLTAAGVALVAAGSLVVVAARRRREDVPAGLA